MPTQNKERSRHMKQVLMDGQQTDRDGQTENMMPLSLSVGGA